MNANNYIEYWRQKHSPPLSREELADKAGLTYNAIRMLEIGEREGKQSSLVQLAQALDVTIEQLLFGPGKPTHDSTTQTWINGRTLRNVRSVKGILPDEFAERIGISLKALEGAEEGTFGVLMTDADKIARELGINIREIMESTGNLHGILEDINNKGALGHAEQHTTCSICTFHNKKNVTTCENCGQPLTGSPRTIVLHPKGKDPVTKDYIVPHPDANENEKRRRIQDITWKLTGDHLDHLYQTAAMCEKCVEAGVEKKSGRSAS